MNINESGLQRCEAVLRDVSRLCVAVDTNQHGTQLIDFGIAAQGGIQAGRALSEVCLAGLGQTTIVAGTPTIWPGLAVTISTDAPLPACMGAQYAGWPVEVDQYFAMGSGPMRAARGREPLLERLELIEQTDRAIGVLESGQLPPVAVCDEIAQQCRVHPSKLTLLVAPTRSIAGTIQVVSRSVETALHKMHELGYDLTSIISGIGMAPLPPIAADDLTGVGRTNDAVLYGGQVTLWVHDNDDRLAEIGPQIPSSSSSDHGAPFAEIFRRYNHDFYKIDPLLFSPAVVTLHNVKTGRTFQFGETRGDVLRKSFLPDDDAGE